MTQPSQQKAAFEHFKSGAMLAGRDKWRESRPHFLMAHKTDPEQIRYALYLGGAMWESGDRAQAVAFWSLSADKDPAIRTLQYFAEVDDMTRQVSRVADSQIRKTLSELQSGVISKQENPGRISTARWPQTHMTPTQYPEGGPRPYIFYAPDLPSVPIFDRVAASWAKELERHTDVMRDEFLALTETNVIGQPYVQDGGNLSGEWDKLKGQDSWTSFHLFKDGHRQAAADHCPRTCAALKAVPVVEHNNHPMEVFFSVLQPGTMIPPHFGLANSRLTVHLPLIIPENCAIRVGETEHTWKEGEAFLFDDSHDHEAWNKSEETRVVLIFEAWRPDMTDGEILAVEASFKARQEWLDGRRAPK